METNNSVNTLTDIERNNENVIVTTWTNGAKSVEVIPYEQFKPFVVGEGESLTELHSGHGKLTFTVTLGKVILIMYGSGDGTVIGHCALPGALKVY